MFVDCYGKRVHCGAADLYEVMDSFLLSPYCPLPAMLPMSATGFNQQGHSWMRNWEPIPPNLVLPLPTYKGWSHRIMKLNHIFLSIDAADFAAQSDWWSKMIGRRWDREPMPSCHEWKLTDDVLFQVLDNAEERGGATVTMHVPDLDAQIERLAEAGIEVPEPVKVEGFDNLRFAQFHDPEGNTVGLLDGS